MPTGYTAAVGEGKITTLRQFALQCARGMGTCISMRDEPWDAPIPERFEPSTDYHNEALSKAKALLAEVDDASDEECEIKAEAEYQRRMASHEMYEAERKVENERYQSMLAAVEALETEADGIKDFMADQLRISISDFISPPPEKMTGPEWREETRRAALRGIAYHEKGIAEEIHRVEMRNLWLAALRRSLPVE